MRIGDFSAQRGSRICSCGFPHLMRPATTVGGQPSGEYLDGMYETLVLVHILAAMVRVGGGFVLMTVEQRAYVRFAPLAVAMLAIIVLLMVFKTGGLT